MTDRGHAAEANAAAAHTVFGIPEVAMRVEIRNGEDPNMVDLSVADAGLGIPAVMRVTPGHEGHPLASVPPGHRFEGYPGDFGAPRTLLVVARLPRQADRPAGSRSGVRAAPRALGRGCHPVTARRTWRDPWPATPHNEDAETRHLQLERMERVYDWVAAYQRDAAMLAKVGWQVTPVDHRRVPGGIIRAAAASWLLGHRRAGPELIVRYRRFH
ncbi:MAG TPA: hypothetical protein VH482_13015 [Thermomicrobiales bacterium]